MSRSPVQVREVRLDDAPTLRELWGLAPARTQAQAPLADVDSAVRKVLASDRERILLAEVQGRVAGAVHVRIGPLAPMVQDLAVFVSHLTVMPEFRRRGVARTLMGVGVAWAEENGIAHIVAMNGVNSRDASRFMARLGLGQAAVLRVAPTAAVRAKLPLELPGAPRPIAGQRPLSQVLAARRSMRRSQGVS